MHWFGICFFFLRLTKLSMSKSHLCQPHRYGSIKYSFPWYLKLDYLRKTISMVLKIIKHNSFNRRAPSSSVQSCPTLCDPIDCSMPGLPVHHQLLEFTQTHVHCVGDGIQPSHALSSPSPPALNLSQHQGLFKWVSSSHQVAKVLEFQLQHQSFQWTPRTDLL